MLVDPDLELLVHRLGVEACRRGVLRLDQLARHAVAREIIEADILERPGELRGGLLGGARRAGQEGRDIDQRDRAADQNRRRSRCEGRAGNRLVHGGLLRREF